MIPGEVTAGAGPPGEPAASDLLEVDVVNDGDRPVQVGSHYHLFEVNPALRLPRADVYGRRLAIPAGGAVRFEPGERRRVATVPFGGARVVRGFLGVVDGPLDAPGARETAIVRARARGVRDL
jgi:urease beta subunit